MDRAQSLAQANARLAAAFKINRPTQKTPLCSIMQRLTKVPLLSNYFQNEQGITGIDNITNQLNTLFNQLNLLAQQSMMMIDIQSNNNSAGVIAQAKEIIVSFLKENNLNGTDFSRLMAKKLLDPACTSAEVVRGFLSLPIQGEVDLGQFLTGRLSQIHSGNQTAFSELYIVLRAAEKLSGQENVAAITSPANVQQLVVTKPEERSMNPAIRSKVAQGHIYNSAKAARGNSTQKTIMMDLLVNSQPNKIMDLLEVSIEHVSNLYRPVIENRVNQLLEEIRRDGQSQPQDLHDANELINRTLTQVQQAISTCEANGNLVALRQNFQDALMILAYYYPPATSKPVPEHLSTLINHIEKRTNSVPENKGNELAQLSSKDEIRELMAKAGLNVLEIDELEGANVLKIGLPEEIQALIGEKEDYYCPQIKLPNFAGEDLPFGTVLMNCLVPPVEDQAVAERILSAQLDILDKLSDALGANPSCYYTGIKNKSATPTHELNNRGFRFFFSPQPNKIQAKVNNILDLYQTKPEDKITRRELYSKKVKSRYSIDMGTGQLRLHTALEDVQPIPDGELVFLA